MVWVVGRAVDSGSEQSEYRQRDMGDSAKEDALTSVEMYPGAIAFTLTPFADQPFENAFICQGKTNTSIVNPRAQPFRFHSRYPERHVSQPRRRRR